MCFFCVTTEEFLTPQQMIEKVKSLLEQDGDVDVVVELPQRCIPRYREELMELLDNDSMSYTIVGRSTNGFILNVGTTLERRNKVHLYDGPREKFIAGLHD